MPLAAVALLPLMVRHLTDVGSGLQRMTLADLVTVNTPGYDISVSPPKILTFAIFVSQRLWRRRSHLTAADFLAPHFSRLPI